MLQRYGRVFGLLFAALLLLGMPAYAGVFTLPHYVAPGNFSLGIEPEVVLSEGSGIGFNAKYTQGLTDLMNFTGLLGTSGGPRKFRVGGQLGFDFFPDIEGQPGIGIVASLIYYRLATDGQTEITGIPYIHKNFIHGSSAVEPFFALPFGFNILSQSSFTATAVVGAMFQSSPHVRYTLELGIAIDNTQSYVSGGVSYFK